MSPATGPRVVCLSNVFDENYATLRGEEIDGCLSTAKRRDLFRCLELATGREVLLISSPPKASLRRRPRWLASVESRFSSHRQYFSANWDAPKIRVPFSWFTYAWKVLRETRSGDLVVIDNYELIYVLAARLAQFIRPLTFVLEYEDGKHVIDHSWSRLLSRLAERLGRPLVRAGLVAHPALVARLPAGIPVEMVPGFFADYGRGTEPPAPPVRFLYSGSLDTTRGVDLLLAAIAELHCDGWRLDISGAGPLAGSVAALAAEPRWQEKVTFHGTLSAAAYAALVASCHVGLNCQRPSDSISGVTFPSKVFSYLSAGLKVLSSEASGVREICGGVCTYYTEETPRALATAMQSLLPARWNADERTARENLRARYSIEGTALRLRGLFDAVRVIRR